MSHHEPTRASDGMFCPGVHVGVPARFRSIGNVWFRPWSISPRGFTLTPLKPACQIFWRCQTLRLRPRCQVHASSEWQQELKHGACKYALHAGFMDPVSSASGGGIGGKSCPTFLLISKRKPHVEIMVQNRSTLIQVRKHKRRHVSSYLMHAKQKLARNRVTTLAIFTHAQQADRFLRCWNMSVGPA